MTKMYELSDRLRRIANDLSVAGFESWPEDLNDIASKASDLEGRLWAMELRLAEIERRGYVPDEEARPYIPGREAMPFGACIDD